VIAIATQGRLAEWSSIAALRQEDPHIGLAPASDWLLMGVRLHSFGHDFVMRVSWNGIARSRGRLLKAASGQVGAIIPVVLLAALLVVSLTLLASNGVRVSYRYRSIGEGGCIKLRAMTTDAEHELETDPVDPAKWLAAWTLQNDIAPLLKPITLCSFSAARSNPALVWISTNHQAGL
jgi:hypothetical protein